MRKFRVFKIVIGVIAFLIIITALLFLYSLATRPKKIPKVPLPAGVKGKIALVIDDWGYNLNNLDIIRQIRYPLTASVLPNLNYSRILARELRKLNIEIMLHLPMEPREKFRLEQNTIMASMDDLSIMTILDQDLLNVPYIAGVSNHMGSKATEDFNTMQIIFKELKRRGLYFLDSVVTSKSICSNLAKKIELPFAKRNVFLDNIDEAESIKKQIRTLKIMANIHGQAIGIGHDRKTTLEVLKEAMPSLEKEGYKFVYVSDLVR